MTTVETALLSLAEATTEAGVGGLIVRQGDVYTVGRDGDGWTLTRQGSTNAQSEALFMTNGWSVVSKAQPAETLWVTLAEACADTGVGGVVRFSSYQEATGGSIYTVGQDEDGDWTLTGNGYTDEPMSTFTSGESNWTVDPPEETPAEPVVPQVVTFADFFNNLQDGTYIRPSWDRHTHYIFKGWEYDSEGERFARIVHARYMEFTDYKGDALLGNSEEFSVVMLDDDSGPKIADQALRMALRHLGAEKNQVRELGEQVAATEKSFREVVSDFKLLNAHLGDYANRNHMCSDYEKQLWEWNDTFAAMKLVGRDKKYYVSVRIPFVHEGQPVNVIVESANGPEDAREKVRAMSTREIMTSLMEQGYMDYVQVDKSAMFENVSEPYC